MAHETVLVADSGGQEIAVRVRHHGGTYRVEGCTSTHPDWRTLLSEVGPYSPGRLAALADLVADLVGPAAVAAETAAVAR